MKRTLKYSALLAGVLITITGTAYAAECASDSDCPNGQGCMAPWSFDQDPEDFTCRPLSDRITSFGGKNSGGSTNREKTSNPFTRFFNALVDIIRPIAPPTITPIVRTTATAVAPNATQTYNAMAGLMRRIEEARRNAIVETPTILRDGEGEYICVPNESSETGNGGGSSNGICAYPASCNIGGYGESLGSDDCQEDIEDMDTSRC